jgi:hypothetical protein
MTQLQRIASAGHAGSGHHPVELLAHGRRVVAFDNLSPSHRAAVPGQAPFEGASSDRSAVARFFIRGREAPRVAA